ncbi:MAG TPA: hypothetical protein VEH62_02940 [Gemmatimonadales bacterium]|nr:hypothetical protein [Gemmatimonadales bacterium]
MSGARALAVVAACVAAAASGCVYFNGMYLANHYTGQAEASERAGRMSEARDRWQLAETHAESLLTHHPKSRWAGEAWLVRGRALVHMEAYSDGIVALQEAAGLVGSREQRLEALGLLGHAYLVIGMADSARGALDSAVGSRRREVRDLALLDRGRLLLQLGAPDPARADFERSRDPRAPYELGRLELVLDDTAAAGALYDSLARGRSFPEDDWRRALDSLAAAGASAHATALAQALGRRPNIPSGAKARLLLDDGLRRLAAGDTAGAGTELQQVVGVARDSVAGQAAAVVLCRLAIAGAQTDSDLERQRDALVDLRMAGGTAGRDAQTTLRLLARLDTLAASPRAPDAFWFLRAELLRDSLGAARLAAGAFVAMADSYPQSPWTPKALVAAIAAGYPAPDTVRDLLASRYAGSPYTLAAEGSSAGGDSAYVVLEDSLRRTLAVAGPSARPVPGRRRPGVVGAVDDDDRPRVPRPAPVPPARPQPAGPPRPEPPE